MGEALVDLVPASGEKQLYRAQPGGAPANVAVGLARLGGRSHFAGGIGADGFAQQLEQWLTGSGVDHSLCRRSLLPTALAVTDPGHDGNAYHFHTERTATFDLSDLSPEVHRFDAVYVGGLAAILEPAASVVASTARAAASRSLLVVDPNVREDRGVDAQRSLKRLRTLCEEADVVKASDEDIARLWPDRDPEASCRRLASGGRLVVMTRGARGSTAYALAREPVSVPAARVKLVNSIGAGDAFMAGVLTWLSAHAWRLDLPAGQTSAMLAYASRVAGSVCAQSGTEPSMSHRL
ncbi:sugar kinase (plasmid) [Streptomyces zhihengii]|uniref:Sugar kinase n=2 Tax=Streptomyces zhihengii TaxID=1818004 RepID=A0ABS2V3W1_9ACTN|nr:sugar kinase [Streptomyces zhihengii]